MVAFKNSDLETRILKKCLEVDRNPYRTKISRKAKWKLIHERTSAELDAFPTKRFSHIWMRTGEVKTIGKAGGASIDRGSKAAAFGNALVAQRFVSKRNRNP